MSTPVPSSKPALIAEPGGDVDVPMELLGPARRRADPEVQLQARAEAPPGGRPAPGRAAPRRARRGRSAAAAVRGTSRSSNGERDAQGQKSAASLVDRDEPIPPPHLLDDHVLEQVAPHRALVVGGEALALAGDLGRDEREREELGVGVREGRAGVGALVDDEVDEGGVVGVGGDPRSPGRDRPVEPGRVEVGERAHVPRRVDDHLVGARGRRRP